MIDKLKKVIHDLKPHFEPGGKYEKLGVTFDAMETFLFQPGNVARDGAHIRDGIDLKRTMFTVVISLIPCLLFGIWNVGHFHYVAAGEFMGLGEGFLEKIIHGTIVVLPIVIVSYGVGLGVEFLFATLRNHQVNEGFLVTGMLIPLIMPPTIPLWMVAVATVFAVIIGKEVFGGTGMNILNVALTARVFVFFAYPAQMSGDEVWITGLQNAADGFSGATPLAEAARSEVSQYSILDMTMGWIPGSVGETSVIAILLGAALLIITGIGNWKIMFSMVVGGLVMGLIFNLIGINFFMQMPFYEHILIGGFLFGAVYMATDPVTAAQTERGKWIYGFLAGFIAVMIRVFNPAYPEGVMLAILLMNVFAPLIDYYVVQANIKRRVARAA